MSEVLHPRAQWRGDVPSVVRGQDPDYVAGVQLERWKREVRPATGGLAFKECVQRSVGPVIHAATGLVDLVEKNHRIDMVVINQTVEETTGLCVGPKFSRA